MFLRGLYVELQTRLILCEELKYVKLIISVHFYAKKEVIATVQLFNRENKGLRNFFRLIGKNPDNKDIIVPK